MTRAPASASSTPGLLALLFGSDGPVDRKRYLLAGASLMLIKYGLDAGLIYALTGHLWLSRSSTSARPSRRARRSSAAATSGRSR
jgi:hypothetical protein